MPSVTNIAELLNAAPPENTAVILPENGIRISYKGLREQVMTMADALAAAGIGPGDRAPSSPSSLFSSPAPPLPAPPPPPTPLPPYYFFLLYRKPPPAKLLLCPP